MPFTKNYDVVFYDSICPAVKTIGYDCERSDNPFRLGGIVKAIITKIFEADIIIADISNANPNVFYELGISHTVTNDVILICEKTEEPIPFDLKDFTIIFYDKNSDRGILELRNKINNILSRPKEIISNHANPVQLFRPVKYVTPLLEQGLIEGRCRKLEKENYQLVNEKREQHSLVEVMFVLTVTSDDERNILKLLAGEAPFYYEKHAIFINELKNLKALKLVKLINIGKLEDIPDDGCLKQIVQLTSSGKTFLKLMGRI